MATHRSPRLTARDAPGVMVPQSLAIRPNYRADEHGRAAEILMPNGRTIGRPVNKLVPLEAMVTKEEGEEGAATSMKGMRRPQSRPQQISGAGFPQREHSTSTHHSPP